ncbi:MAG: STAS domain-containing protein [Actinomycetota bacterium]
MTTPLAIEALPDEPGLRVAGELDASNVTDLASRLEDLVAGDSITLDLTALEFIDSAGMNALITVARNLAEGSRMTMRVLPEGPVRRVIDLMGIADVLDTVVLVEPEDEG